MIIFTLLFVVSCLSRIQGSDLNIASVKINFKPFPSVGAGLSVWDAITPRYSYRDGGIRPIHNPYLQVEPATPATPATPRESLRAQRPISLSPNLQIQTQNKFQSSRSFSKRYLQQQVNSIPVKQPVRDYIFKWWTSSIGSGLQNVDALSNQKVVVDTKQLKCTLKIFDFSNPTQDLINSGQPLDVLYPGSFVQGKFIESGGQTLVRLPISDNYRHPIKIAGNGNFVPVMAASSLASDVHRKIKEAIWNSQSFLSPDVYIKLVKSSQISSLLLSINVNAKITKALGISGTFSSSSATKKNSYFITMIQGIADFFPEKYQVDQNDPINDPIGVFLKQSFTVDDVKALQGSYMGDGNIPCFINQVTLGRLMMISVQENEKTKQLYGKLSADLAGIGSLSASVTMTQLFQDVSVKVFSVGPFNPVEVSDLKAGTWTNFFQTIPANAALVQALTPMKYHIQDFKGNPVRVSNRLQYEQIECQTKQLPKNVIVILSEVYKNARLQIKRTGSNDFQSIKELGPGQTQGFDITNQLTSGDSDFIRVSSTVGKPNLLSRYQRSVRLTIQINNAQVYNQKVQCKSCGSIDAFTCVINKYSGYVNCVKG